MGKKDDKQRTLENTVKAIEKQFGSGAIMQLGDRPDTKLAAISLGTLGIDVALGIGGLPRGRIVEVFGHESSGKTTLALTRSQRRNETEVFVHSWMRSMRWIQCMLRLLGLI